MVELEEGNTTNEVDEQNVNQNEPNNTNTTTVPDKPKQVVNIPYYIKVNYGANVVTVYKKDSAREVYSSS